MAKLQFDAPGEKLFETGVENCVLYLKDSSGRYPKGVAWNGITNVTSGNAGGEAESYFMDGIKYLELRENDLFHGTIEAYTYPEEFEVCDGSLELEEGVFLRQQRHAEFGLCYKTLLGNDTKFEDYGYKLHIIYNATATPSERSYATINNDPELSTFSWDISTVPIVVSGCRPASELVLDSTKIGRRGMKFIEDILYGSDSNDPYLLFPREIAELVALSKMDVVLVDGYGNVIGTNDGYNIKIEELW